MIEYTLEPVMIVADLAAYCRFKQIIKLTPSLYNSYSMWSGLGKSTKAVAPEVYPEDIECVRDPVGGAGGIYISNLEAAQNLRTLGRHGIKAVITAANGAYLNHSRS